MYGQREWRRRVDWLNALKGLVDNQPKICDDVDSDLLSQFRRNLEELRVVAQVESNSFTRVQKTLCGDLRAWSDEVYKECKVRSDKMHDSCIAAKKKILEASTESLAKIAFGTDSKEWWTNSLEPGCNMDDVQTLYESMDLASVNLMTIETGIKTLLDSWELYVRERDLAGCTDEAEGWDGVWSVAKRGMITILELGLMKCYAEKDADKAVLRTNVMRCVSAYRAWDKAKHKEKADLILPMYEWAYGVATQNAKKK